MRKLAEIRTSPRRESRRLSVRLVLVAVALACGSPEDTSQEHLERARSARDAGQHEVAVIEYRNVLQLDPNHAGAHYGLALSLLDLGRGDDAAWELRESIRLDPDNLEARQRFAWLAVAGGSADEAIEQASAILERDAESVDARLVRGAALLQQGKLEEAAKEGESILARRPDEKRAHYHLAHVRAAQNKLPAAERNLLRYRELDERSASATREVLRFYLATAQLGEAEAFLKRAIPEAASPDRAEPALALASLLEKDGRLDEAEPFLLKALAVNAGRLDVRERWATLLARSGRVDQGLELMADDQLTAPPDAEIHRIRGDLLIEAARFDAALAEYRTALELEPDSDVYRLREAEALLRMGDIEASGERIRSLLAENPDDPMLALAQIRTLALSSRSREAIESLQQLLAHDPKLSGAHFLLGVLQLASDRPTEASRSLEAAAAGITGGDDRELRRLLAEAQLRSGDFTSAAKNAELALTADANDIRARILLARAQLESGSPERAEALLREGSVESAGVQATLARIYVKTERLDLAEAAVQRALALEPDSVQWVVDLVWVLSEQGKLDAALEAARSRMQEHPDVPEYPNLVGQVQLQREDQAGADRAFRRAVQVDPEFITGYVNLARLATRSMRYADAREMLQRALVQQPGNPEALRELGLVEFRQGDADAAVEAFEAALRADPTSEVTRSNLAQAKAKVGGELSSVIEVARAMRQSDPDNPVYAETLGLVLHRSGLPGPAAQQFRDAIENAPHPIAIYHYRLGLALQDGGDKPGAARELERALALDASFESAEDARRRLAELAP